MFFGSIVALVTPFNHQEQVDYKKLKELIAWHLSEGTDAILLCGTTGECATLSELEKLSILKAALDVAHHKIPILIGTGSNDTKASVLLTKQAQKMGADGCLAIVPYYNKPEPVGIFRHFEEIAKIGLPVICYHHPKRTGISLKPSFLAELINIPHIVAIKDSSSDVQMITQALSIASMDILSGDDPITCEMLKSGAKGSISVIANLIPREWKKLITCFQQKKEEKAFALQQKFMPLIQALFRETSPQGIKYALSLVNKVGLNYRLPLLAPSQEVQKTIQKEMKSLDLI